MIKVSGVELFSVMDKHQHDNIQYMCKLLLPLRYGAVIVACGRGDSEEEAHNKALDRFIEDYEGILF